MASFKSRELKKKLAKALSQNRRIPVFVIAKTKRQITFNSKSRNWHKKKLKLKGLK